MAGWAGLHSFVSIRTLHSVRALPSAGAPSARVKRDKAQLLQHLPREIDGLESTRSTADPIDTFRIIRCVIQEDYTIESHALPPSQPQPPAHGRRSEWNEPNARPPTTTRPASSQPQLIKQVPSGSQNVTGPHRPTSRPGYAPAVSCWARVFQRSIGPWWPRFIHRGPVHERATKYFVTGAPSLPCSKNGGFLCDLVNHRSLPPRCTPPPTITSAVRPLPLSVSAGPLAGLLFLG